MFICACAWEMPMQWGHLQGMSKSGVSQLRVGTNHKPLTSTNSQTNLGCLISLRSFHMTWTKGESLPNPITGQVLQLVSWWSLMNRTWNFSKMLLIRRWGLGGFVPVLVATSRMDRRPCLRVEVHNNAVLLANTLPLTFSCLEWSNIMLGCSEIEKVR